MPLPFHLVCVPRLQGERDRGSRREKDLEGDRASGDGGGGTGDEGTPSSDRNSRVKAKKKGAERRGRSKRANSQLRAFLSNKGDRVRLGFFLCLGVFLY